MKRNSYSMIFIMTWLVIQYAEPGYCASVKNDVSRLEINSIWQISLKDLVQNFDRVAFEFNPQKNGVTLEFDNNSVKNYIAIDIKGNEMFRIPKETIPDNGQITLKDVLVDQSYYVGNYYGTITNNTSGLAQKAFTLFSVDDKGNLTEVWHTLLTCRGHAENRLYQICPDDFVLTAEGCVALWAGSNDLALGQTYLAIYKPDGNKLWEKECWITKKNEMAEGWQPIECIQGMQIFNDKLFLFKIRSCAADEQVLTKTMLLDNNGKILWEKGEDNKNRLIRIFTSGSSVTEDSLGRPILQRNGRAITFNDAQYRELISKGQISNRVYYDRDNKVNLICVAREKDGNETLLAYNLDENKKLWELSNLNTGDHIVRIDVASETRLILVGKRNKGKNIINIIDDHGNSLGVQEVHSQYQIQSTQESLKILSKGENTIELFEVLFGN